MATVLLTAPPAQMSTTMTTRYHNHRRLIHTLTQSSTVSIPHLKQIHAQIIRITQPPNHSSDTLFLYSRLLYFSSMEDLTYSLQLFNQISNPNTFIYNTLIRAYAHSKNHKGQAFSLFQELLKHESLIPDKHTFPFVLKACAYLFALSEGKQAHAHALKHGFGDDKYVNNNLIHFYASCGCSESARKVFDKMPERSLVSWNVIINALVQMGEFDQTLRMFVKMMSSLEPDGYTLQSVIDACANLGALSMGMWAHAYLLRRYANFDIILSNSLIGMYSKCGSLKMAQQVFQEMSLRDVHSWNAMILGFTMHGQAENAFDLLDQMINEGKVKPNPITFVAVLSACNHRGLVDEASKYFDIMVNEFKMEPAFQHYGCLIDILARNDRINEALDIVSTMPMKPDAVIWRSLLDACCKNSENLHLSQEIATQVIAAEGSSKTSGVYVLLSKVYASAKQWNEVGLVRKLMSEKGINKEPGCSSVEINGIVHEFFAGDTTHPETKGIYQFLDVIGEKLKREGYVPDVSQAVLVDDEGKGASLSLHSERLAIAFALLKSKPGDPIRVFKNLRICGDCHSFSKLVSKVFSVEIIMRDRLRFHHFKDGSCSCMDVW